MIRQWPFTAHQRLFGLWWPAGRRRPGAEVEGVGFAGGDHDRRKAYSSRQRDPWNKARMTGQKRPLKPKDVWTIRVRLQLEGRKRDLAMFNRPSTASSGVVTWCGSGSTTYSPAEEFAIERR
jgi:hypothetical protein